MARMLFSDDPDLLSSFRSNTAIQLGNVQNIRLSEYEREECRLFDYSTKDSL